MSLNLSVNSYIAMVVKTNAFVNMVPDTSSKAETVTHREKLGDVKAEHLAVRLADRLAEVEEKTVRERKGKYNFNLNTAL